MKTFAVLLALSLSFTACANGAKPVKNYERKDTRKFFVPCKSQWQVEAIPANRPGFPVGSLCNRVCVDRHGKTGECVGKWTTNIKKFDDPTDFTFFEQGSFIFINEGYVFH
jgi:hypothetical protein